MPRRPRVVAPAPAPEDKEPKDPLARARKILEKEFGAGIIHTTHELTQKHPVYPTGIVTLDRALGIGGLPRGRSIELFGPQGGGKSTLAMHAVVPVQNLKKRVLYIDFEHTFDPIYASKIGVKFEDDLWVLSQPQNFQEGMRVFEVFLKDPALNLGMCIVDSLAAGSPREEMESATGTQPSITGVAIGRQSLLAGQALKHLTPHLKEHGVTFLIVNQIRHKIGSFISTETTPGGEAPKHYASVRIEVRKAGLIKDAASREMLDFSFEGVDQTAPKHFGMRTILNVVKNKLAIPYRRTELNLIFGQGYDKVKDAYMFGVDHKLFAHDHGRLVYEVLDKCQNKGYKLVFKDMDEFRKLVSQDNLYFAVYDKMMEVKEEALQTAVPSGEENADGSNQEQDVGEL